jgi:ribonuclease PH
MTRTANRPADRLRPVKITPGFIRSADGSALIKIGRTRVVCTATVENRTPPWRRNTGKGWVTAEYGMLPASTGTRNRRPGPGRVNSRGTEIQRLIGRALRAGIDLDALGENTVTVDCDVLEADGGTRTAAVTGGWVALVRAVAAARKRGRLPDGPDPVTDQVVAVSCGLVGGRAILDLNYREDSEADADMNVVMTPDGRLIEVQVSGEEATFRRSDLSRLLRLAHSGCERLAKKQLRAVQQKR